MVKTLKRKFVKTSMTAVTALLLIFILSVNAVNVVVSYRRNNQKLTAVNYDIFHAEMRGDGFRPPEEIPTGDIEDEEEDYDDLSDDYRMKKELPKEAPLFGISRDDAEGARFFKATTDPLGNIVSADTGHISSVTEDEAKELAEAVIKSRKAKGFTDGFMYMSSSDSSGTKTVTFLDISSDLSGITAVLLISFSAGALCWLLMLLLTSKASDRAIKPIAENIERQKQFVTDAGHEIKTPLAVIKANAEAMELYNGENKWSKNIKSQVDRMTELMQNLLTLAKSDENVPESAIEPVSLSELSEKAVSAYTEAAVSNGKKIIADTAPGVTVNSNAKLIERILDILLDNALKYSSAESEIKYTLTSSKKHGEIHIENICDSLPDCEPEKLFDRFYRSDSSRNSEGFGIGLSSAKSTAESLGGSLTAKFKENNTVEFILKI